MKTTISILLAVFALFAFTGCNHQPDRFIGLWNKDLNVQYDSISFPLWTSKDLRLPVDRKVITTPVFLRIAKDGEFYKIVGYYYDFANRTFIADVTIPENARFKKLDDLTLISDNEYANSSVKEHLAIRVNASSGAITLDFPIDKAAVPNNEKSKANFYTMLKSGFHRVLEVGNNTGISEIQKSLQSQKAIF
jgi:hypothetical protein